MTISLPRMRKIVAVEVITTECLSTALFYSRWMLLQSSGLLVFLIIREYMGLGREAKTVKAARLWTRLSSLILIPFAASAMIIMLDYIFFEGALAIVSSILTMIGFGLILWVFIRLFWELSERD
jgi:hypothetical protein